MSLAEVNWDFRTLKASIARKILVLQYSTTAYAIILCRLSLKLTVDSIYSKVHTFWEDHRKLHRRSDRYYIGQISGEDFKKFVVFSKYMNFKKIGLNGRSCNSVINFADFCGPSHKIVHATLDQRRLLLHGVRNWVLLMITIKPFINGEKWNLHMPSVLRLRNA